MLYFDISDYLAILVALLAIGTAYYVWSIIKLMGGGPKAWYVFIIAFVARAGYTIYQVWLDLQTPADSLGEMQTGVQVLISLLFLLGAVWLFREFRARKEIQELDAK